MAQAAPERNPFMLMINPEVVLAAMANSERLGQLNRQLCRPLDRVGPPGSGSSQVLHDDAADDGDER